MPPSEPDEPRRPVRSHEAFDEILDDTFDEPHEPVERVAYRVPRAVLAAKLATAVVLALVGLSAGERPRMVLALLAALAVAVYAGRDVVNRVRLRADSGGVVAARGYAGRRRLAWSEIERVRVDQTSRLGARSEMLEIDTGAELFLYSRYDLGVDPEEAAIVLAEMRRRFVGES
jgi:hypothetical protein